MILPGLCIALAIVLAALFGYAAGRESSRRHESHFRDLEPIDPDLFDPWP